MKTLVVAANNKEDTAWTNGVPPEWDLNINRNFQPAGRETDTYLYHIINYYNSPYDEVALCHGNPFDHDSTFLYHLNDSHIRYYGPIEACDPQGMPRIEWAMLDEWCKVLGLTPQTSYTFVAGAQYRLTKEQIQFRSLDFYKALYYLTKIPANPALYPGTNMLTNPSAYSLERLWPLIWNISLP